MVLIAYGLLYVLQIFPPHSGAAVATLSTVQPDSPPSLACTSQSTLANDPVVKALFSSPPLARQYLRVGLEDRSVDSPDIPNHSDCTFLAPSIISPANIFATDLTARITLAGADCESVWLTICTSIISNSTFFTQIISEHTRLITASDNRLDLQASYRQN